MSFYQINSNNLRAGRDELLGLNERLRSESEKLNSCEIALKNMWEGEANERFHQNFIKNSAQMDSFCRLITRYCEVMDVIAGRYDSAEQKNLAVARGKGF